MGKFMQRDRGSRGRSFGGRSFGSRGDRGFGRRDGERPTMHQAVCSECGQDCEVPFKPSGDKPVLCDACFSRSKGRSDSRKFSKSPRRDDFGPKRMFPAVCSECGRDCEVPFRPSSDKPVLCDECFGQSGRRSERRPRQGGDNNQLAAQLQAISEKLDRVLQSLVTEKKTKPAEEVVLPEIKEKPAVKKAKTKAAKPAAAVKKAKKSRK